MQTLPHPQKKELALENEDGRRQDLKNVKLLNETWSYFLHPKGVLHMHEHKWVWRWGFVCFWIYLFILNKTSKSLHILR